MAIRLVTLFLIVALCAGCSRASDRLRGVKDTCPCNQLADR